MGTSTSGNRNGGKSLTDKFQRALTKAIKQAEIANNRKPLDVLLADLMQADVAKFMQVASPYIPKEIVIDHSISILAALDDAQSRIISMRESVVASLPSGALTDTVPLTVDSEAVRVDESQGGVG